MFLFINSFLLVLLIGGGSLVSGKTMSFSYDGKLETVGMSVLEDPSSSRDVITLEFLEQYVANQTALIKEEILADLTTVVVVHTQLVTPLSPRHLVTFPELDSSRTRHVFVSPIKDAEETIGCSVGTESDTEYTIWCRLMAVNSDMTPTALSVVAFDVRKQTASSLIRFNDGIITNSAPLQFSDYGGGASHVFMQIKHADFTEPSYFTSWCGGTMNELGCGASYCWDNSVAYRSCTVDVMRVSQSVEAVPDEYQFGSFYNPANTQSTVVFDSPFTSPPVVLSYCHQTDNGGAPVPVVNSVTTNGFTHRMRWQDGSSWDCDEVLWMAFEAGSRINFV